MILAKMDDYELTSRASKASKTEFSERPVEPHGETARTRDETELARFGKKQQLRVSFLQAQVHWKKRLSSLNGKYAA